MSLSTQIALKTNDKFQFFCNYISNKIKSTWSHIKKSDSWQLAGIITAVALLCFATTYIQNMFTIPLGGDFVLQMIPFQFKGYDDWHTFFRTGVFPTWDSSGIFGFSNIGGNSYYYLFDPWFLIMLIFPRSWLPQLQGIGTVVKMVTGGVLFYHYLGCFKISISTRKIGAVCYAFCGWTFYYLWFHFINITAVLPLLFWGIENVIQKKKPTMLIGSLILLCLINYYFFICFCFGSVFYAVFRALQEVKKNKARETFKIIGMGIACFGIAILTVSICLLPSILNTLSMPRVSSSQSFIDMIKAAKGFSAKLKVLFTWESTPYKALYPLNSFLVIPLGCFSQSLFSTTGYDNTASSLYVMAPMILMLVPSVLDSIKQKKYSHLIGFVAVTIMLFTPFTYYLMFAFVKEYGRWEIMPVMWMLVFFCIHFDRHRQMPRWYMDASALFTAFLYLILITLSNKYTSSKDYSWALNPWNSDQKLAIVLQCVWVFICYVIMRMGLKKRELNTTLLYMICLEAVVIGNVTVRYQGTSRFQDLSGGISNVNEETRLVKELNKYDNSTFRIYNSSADRGSPNLSLREGYNGIAAFHSVYAYQTQDFIDWSRISYTYGNWSMGVHEKRYNLETFMGVKYYLLKKTSGTDIQNVPYGYTNILEKEDCPEELKRLLNNGNHELYVNDNYIDLGFAYDNIVSSSYLSRTTYADFNESKYLKYGIVEKDDIDEINNASEDIKAVVPTDTSEIFSARTNDLNYVDYTIYRANYDDNGYIIAEDPNHELTDEEKKQPNPNQYGIYRGDTKLEYNSTNAKELPIWSKIVVDFKNGNTVCSAAETRGGCYVSVDFKFGYNVDFAFFDAEGNKITNDMHMWNGYDKTSDWKYARGFYVDRPVSRIVATTRDNIIPGFVFDKFSTYYQYNDVYQANIDKLKANALEDVSYNTDANISFKTNYESDKFVVTNVAYDEGWSIKRREVGSNKPYEDVKIYKGQGGFNAFIAEKGNYEYSMVYKTPGLDISKGFTLIGAFTYYVIFACYYSIRLQEKLYENPIFNLKSQKVKRKKRNLRQ